MLCTECGQEIKPIVAVDIDGTLAEYHLTLEKFACEYWDVPRPVATWGGLGNFEDHIGITQAMYREAKLAYRQGGYKRMAPAYPFALQFMKWVNTLNVELWITTTRPWSRLDNVDPDTKFWLLRHGIEYDHLLFDDNKYEKLYEIVEAPSRVLAIVDDLPEQCSAARLNFPNAYTVMIERPHNYDTRKGFDTAPNFHVILSIMDDLRKEWQWTKVPS